MHIINNYHLVHHRFTEIGTAAAILGISNVQGDSLSIFAIFIFFENSHLHEI